MQAAGLTVLTFNYRTVQLNRLSWRDFLDKRNPVASALMARMRIARKDRPRVKLECLRLLATLKLNPAKQQLISGFVDTYLRLNKQELVELEKRVSELQPEEEAAVLELPNSWKEQGRAEGRAEGVFSVLCPLLKHRFGADGTAFCQLLREADLSTLNAIAKKAAVADLATLKAIAERPTKRSRKRTL